MRMLFLVAVAVTTISGCTFHRGGSQALSFNPFDWGSGKPAITPADGFGYVDGEPLDMSR